MKDWLIKKLGGYTAREMDGVLKAFDSYAKDIDTIQESMEVIAASVEKQKEVVH